MTSSIIHGIAFSRHTPISTMFSLTTTMLFLWLTLVPLTIMAQNIVPLPDSPFEDTWNGPIHYIDTRGLGQDTTFYTAETLDIQLLADLPAWRVFSEDQHRDRLFEGTSEDGTILVRLLRYTSPTTGITVLAGTAHDRSTNIFYEIKPNANGNDTVTTFSEDDLPPMGEPLVRSWWESATSLYTNRDSYPSWDQIASRITANFQRADPQPEQQSFTIVDVMVLWTTNSECLKSGLEVNCVLTDTTKANMEAAAQLMIEETNTAMINSATGAKLNLVHAQRDDSGYRESRMSETLLHITNTDGQLDYIQALRNEKKADLVQFIVDNRVDTANLGGIAWLPQRAQFWGLGIGCYDCSLGFSVICAQCMTNYVSAHEFGHNLGCLHDRGTSGQCGGTCTNTNYGWRSPDSTYRTIMSYRCVTGECDNNPATGACARIPYFSGPGEYNGQQRGGPNNNCGGEISKLKVDIANYR